LLKLTKKAGELAGNQISATFYSTQEQVTHIPLGFLDRRRRKAPPAATATMATPTATVVSTLCLCRKSMGAASLTTTHTPQSQWAGLVAANEGAGI
jgi:hypothetical protein